MLGLLLLACVVFFMYMWKVEPTPRQGCSTCPNRQSVMD